MKKNCIFKALIVQKILTKGHIDQLFAFLNTCTNKKIDAKFPNISIEKNFGLKRARDACYAALKILYETKFSWVIDFGRQSQRN